MPRFSALNRSCLGWLGPKTVPKNTFLNVLIFFEVNFFSPWLQMHNRLFVHSTSHSANITLVWSNQHLNGHFQRKNPLPALGFKPMTFLPKHFFLTGINNSPSTTLPQLFEIILRVLEEVNYTTDVVIGSITPACTTFNILGTHWFNTAFCYCHLAWYDFWWPAGHCPPNANSHANG